MVLISESTVRKVLVVAQLHLTLCDPMGCSPPGSSVYKILQARIPGVLPFPFSEDLPNPGIEPQVSCIAG